jgi:hypothetical protein
MERSNFFNDQLVVDSDLNNIETTVADQITQRAASELNTAGGVGKATAGYGTFAVVKGGVYGAPVDYLTTTVNLFVSATATQITVAPGQALDAQQNFITVPVSHVVSKGTNSPSGSWVSSAGVTNYVKLSYRETSGSVKANDAGNQFYTRYNASYFVMVDNNAPGALDVLLGQFTADGLGQVTSMLDRRSYVRLNVMADATWLDPTVKPVATWTSVEDHVRAVGTGTPSQTNPHGLTGADIGIVDAVASVRLHRTDSHVNGIIVSDTSLSGALQSFSASVVAGPIDTMVFTSPIAASMSVHGTMVSSAISSILATAAPSVGDYWVAYNIQTGTAQFLTTGSIVFDDTNPRVYENYLRLAFARVDPVGGNIINTVDLRRFGTLSIYDVQPDVLEPVSAAGITGGNGSFEPSQSVANSLANNLARMRNQIGVSLNGVGSKWTPGSPNPLTAGPTSNADAYHTHASLFATGSLLGGLTALLATKSPGNWYQNTTGHPIFVSVYVNNGGGTGNANMSGIELSVWPISGFSLMVIGSEFGDSTATNRPLRASGIVPAGWSYIINTFGSPAPSYTDLYNANWIEITT